MRRTDAFYSELARLQQDFDRLGPKLDICLRDDDIGVEGHIVVWNTAISHGGPLHNCAKGGTRIRPGLTRDEVTMLARNMAIKNAAAGLPLGGCKSGINADPKDKNFERRYRRFVELSKPYLYENGGIFGGFGFDIGAAPEHALWACDTLQSARSFTGKTVEMGGTDYDREGIAGLGVATAAAELLHHQQRDIRQTCFAVHGIGAMGSAVIRYFSDDYFNEDGGAQLCAIGDPKVGGTWRFRDAPSPPLLEALAKQQFDIIANSLPDEADHVSDDSNEVLFTDTDILFPCAVQHVITAENAAAIKAYIIVEGANNPTTTDAYTVLFQRGITHVPDFVANCGGVIAAFVEMTSPTSVEENIRSRAKVQEAKRFTETTIRANVGRVLDVATTLSVPMRDAGLHFALNNVLKHEVLC